MTIHDDQGLLAAYCLHALSSAEAEEVDLHVSTCLDCQRELAELLEMREILDEIPPEALLDGEAEDSDLLFARIMRDAVVEDEPTMPVRPLRRHRTGFWRRGLLVAAAVVLLAAAFAGGVLAQRGVAAPEAAAPPSSTAPASSDTVTLHAISAQTGVGMSMDLTRKVGWVALTGRFTGVRPGTPCDIYLISTSGQRVLAGGWVAPANAYTAVVTINGSAVIDPSDVAAIEVVDTANNQRMVTANVA